MGEEQAKTAEKKEFLCLRGCPYNTGKRDGKILCMGPSMGEFIEPVTQCPFYPGQENRPKDAKNDIGGHTFNSPDK